VRAAPSFLVAPAVSLALVGAPAGAATIELDAAEQRAGDAATDLAAATSRLASLELEIAHLEDRVDHVEAELRSMARRLRRQAVEEFVEDQGPASFLDRDLSLAARADALDRWVSGRSDEVLERYRRTHDDLEHDRAALAEKRRQAAEATAALAEAARWASAELAHLERVALDPPEDAGRRRRAQRPAHSARRPPAPSPARPPAPASRAATPPPAATPAAGGWVCPVRGPHAFTNDWGQPRSGGRRHQGTDLLSPYGTPVVANVGGNLQGHSSALGGVSYYLDGDDGTNYVGMHLSRLSGAAGRVEAGTVVGYVGSSGNAQGASPHLHFEIHPGGGGPVNPYPTVSTYC
jgi:peptidoglycan LD-endopeptidase LytH